MVGIGNVVEGDVVVAATVPVVAIDGSTLDTALLHADNARRQAATRRPGLVAAADHKSQDKTAERTPDEGKVISYRIYGWCTGHPSNGRQSDSTDDAHEDGAEETVCAGEESADEAGNTSDGSDDRESLPG